MDINFKRGVFFFVRMTHSLAFFQFFVTFRSLWNLYTQFNWWTSCVYKKKTLEFFCCMIWVLFLSIMCAHRVSNELTAVKVLGWAFYAPFVKCKQITPYGRCIVCLYLCFPYNWWLNRNLSFIVAISLTWSSFFWRLTRTRLDKVLQCLRTQ
jgi:hypothetical protein